LCVDPLVKAVYTLRCFYGESLKTGADLKADLSQLFAASINLRRSGVTILVVVIMGGTLAAEAHDAGSNPAADPTTSAEAAPGVAASRMSVSAPALDQAIAKTIQQRKYIWRVPRENLPKIDESGQGIISRFFE